MLKTGDKQRSDVPMPAAVALLAVLAVLLLVGADAPRFAVEIEDLLPALERNVLYHCFCLAAGSLAAAWVASQWRRRVKLTKQGSRLNKLLGKSPEKESGVLWQLAGASFAGSTTFAIGLAVTDTELLPFRLTVVQRAAWVAIELMAASSLAFAAVVLSIAIYAPLVKALKCLTKEDRALAPFPELANTLVLGSVHDDAESEVPEWMTVGTRGLNGNILVTGSIGSGKTQGTVLTYFDQLLRGLKPSPSVLAIDPKGSFSPEAKKIIKARGLAKKCLHLRLGGDVLFNPIFEPKILKNARFLDVAYMLQSAGTNFLGRSSDSAFWEAHSFSLIRHALAFCAATKSYYTLLDLYDAIIAAVGDEIPEKIKEAIEVGTFDEEERFNLMRSYDYFALEFRSFEEKVKTSILATATAFLNQFQEFQASRVFCPKEGVPRIKSLRDVVDNGQILLVDIASSALAKSMGTVLKLQYEQAVLDRLKDKKRAKGAPSLLVIDEYQDVVTTSHGSSIGDERFFAKAREANAISIVATQSVSSLQDAIGKESSTRALLQCFRTRIAAHSSDWSTIKDFQELVGKEDREKVSHSLSELSQDTRQNHLLGGFEADNANISESVSTSVQREPILSGKEFSSLKSFEAFALVYDGVKNSFHRLFLKPYFLKNKATLHGDVLAQLAGAAGGVALALGLAAPTAGAFPDICSVVNTPEFSTCMQFSVGSCTCGWPPHACAQFTYFVPTSFVEVHPNAGETFFGSLPAARGQLSGLSGAAAPYGAEDDRETQSFQAHTLSIPLASTVLSTLPCSSSWRDTTCFEAMSEHLGAKWTTGSADGIQPNFLMWMSNPKACLMAGALASIGGGLGGSAVGGGTMCSVPMSLERYPPSAHFACNGWGVFYPRVGVYNGGSQTAGALMVAARMKSLAAEVFQATPSSPAEKWQMIVPQASACFREGENVLPLETFKYATEIGRLGGAPPKGYLFAIWQPTSCCKELTEVPTAEAALAAIRAACQGRGGL